jgi:hypothetical protein
LWKCSRIRRVDTQRLDEGANGKTKLIEMDVVTGIALFLTVAK